MRHTFAVAWLAAATLLGAEATRLSVPAERAIEQVSQAELRVHVETLAGDAYEGRGLATRGNERAAQYAAEQLRLAGTAPAADGYLQPFQVYTPALAGGARLVVESPSATIADLSAETDIFPLPPSSDGAVTGRLVVAGHGIVSRRWRMNDYRHVDARGAIVLVRDGTPPAVKGPQAVDEAGSRLDSLAHKVAAARQHGAAALLVVDDAPESARALWQAEEWRRLPAAADRLRVAAVAERAAKIVRDALDAGVPLTARLSPGVRIQPVTVNNVLAMVEGRGGDGGIVVVGAHLDHDGTDETGRVFNGADDNASGTAAVLAIGAAFARAAAAGDRPARAVVFALWNGEEHGMLGAEHFADSPQPSRPVVANINLDMVGRSEDVPHPDDARFRGFDRTSAAENAHVVHLLGYTHAPDLARLVNRANEAVRLKVRQEYDRGAHGLLRRSDHWAFLKRGIPAIFLTTGLHPDYHTPADDPDRIEYGKLERIAELAARVAWMAADGDTPRFRK